MAITQRSNDAWLEDLADPTAPAYEVAVNDLQHYLKRGIYYYLSRERSDLANLASDELLQMADDFAQDSTLRILKSLDTFRGDSRFTTWAMKIGTRTAISELRRSRYRDFSLEEITAQGEYMLKPDNDNINSDRPANPEKVTEREDVLRVISSALDDILTDKQRQVLEATVLQNIPIDIVAEQMGSNRNALYKLLHDARKKLKSYLEEQGLAVEYIMNLFEQN